jgi:tripartite-type tricarboxylate transporter receptor subunit TctC
MLVGFPPGGAADFVARALGEPLARELGQPLVIENRPGAGSSIAAELAARAAPDGYTVLIASPSSIMVNPLLMPKLGYNAKTDLLPITQVSNSPMVVAVNPATGITTLRELIDAAKKAPGKLNFASSGNTSAPHLAGALFLSIAGVDIVHVPFKGGGPAMIDVIGGHSQVLVSSLIQTMPHVRSGKLKALATGGAKRSAILPDIPTIAEAGVPGYEMTNWWGVVAPAGTPQPILDKLAKEIGAVLSSPETQKQFAAVGAEVVQKSPADFATFFAAELAKWERVVKDAKIKAE